MISQDYHGRSVLTNMEKLDAGTKEENLESESEIEKESLETGSEKHFQMSKLFGSQTVSQSMSHLRILQRQICDQRKSPVTKVSRSMPEYIILDNVAAFFI